MRDLIKIFLVWMVLLCAPFCFADEQKYTVLVIPDNIVTDGAAVDSFIYNQTAEFFSNEVINILNNTDYIECPTVSDERSILKGNPAYLVPARDLMNKFKTTYNIDYPKLKKIAAIQKNRYALLLTSSIDSENYIMRRTLWDVLNIPGAAVIDPAYKISTYAALVDINSNSVLWSNTFYKTISVVENRILTKGPSPQTEQLQKIRDYSRMLCPEIAQNVQEHVLSDDEYRTETNKVYYDMANFDNIFTKKHRRWSREGKKDWNGFRKKFKKKNKKYKTNKTKHQQRKMEVKAEPYSQENVYNSVNSTEKQVQRNNIVQPLDFEDQSLYEPINLKRKWKNNLYGDNNTDRPALRDYDKL